MTKSMRAIIRYANGAVDDVAIDGDLFRMEQMDKDSWWVCIYRGEKRVSFFLDWDRKRREIVAFVNDDSLGCVDDQESDYILGANITPQAKGAPSRTVTLSVRLAHEEMVALEARARERGQTVAEAMRAAVRAHLGGE